MRVLVFGAQGQVGRALVEARWVDGISVTAATRTDANLMQPDSIEAVIARTAPDLVINAAAYTSVDKAESERDTAFAVNATAVEKMAEATAQRAIPLFHISTDYVFYGQGTRANVEDDAIAPLNVYGASKAAGEALLRRAQPKHLILRTSWVYAAHGNNFIRTMQRLGRERDALSVVADQHGAPTSAHAIASTLVTLAERYRKDPAASAPRWGTYHYAAAGETTWHGFAEHVFADMQRRDGRRPICKPIATSDYPTPARRPANSRLDCTKFDRAFSILRAPWQADVDAVLATLAALP